MTTSSLKFTMPRLQALHAVAAVHPQPARRTNTTEIAAGLVYHQTADWLLANGLVEPIDDRGRRLAEAFGWCEQFVLTEAGRTAVHDVLRMDLPA